MVEFESRLEKEIASGAILILEDESKESVKRARGSRKLSKKSDMVFLPVFLSLQFWMWTRKNLLRN